MKSSISLASSYSASDESSIEIGRFDSFLAASAAQHSAHRYLSHMAIHIPSQLFSKWSYYRLGHVPQKRIIRNNRQAGSHPFTQPSSSTKESKTTNKRQLLFNGSLPSPTRKKTDTSEYYTPLAWKWHLITIYRVSHKNDPLPVLFCQDIYNHRHFYSQISHTHMFNMDTHIDHFLLFIFKVYRVW